MKKIFFIAIIIRLFCLYLFHNVTNYDLQSYIQIGQLTLKGINIYPDIANLHHPYLPFFMYMEAVAVWTGISVKIINIIFDLGIVYLVYLLSKKSLKTALIYALNPVTILVTTLHGQFDVIPLFFILLTIYLLSKKWELLAILSFSFAILTKTWPVLLLIPIICRIKNKKLLPLLITFPMIFVLFYVWFFKSSLIDIGKTLISYQGLWGIWGPVVIMGKQRILIQKFTTLIFLISFFIYSWFNRDLPAQAGKNLVKNILSLLFFFFIFTTNFSIQYLVWIIPFLIIIKPKNYLFLICLISIYLCTFYYFLIFCYTCKITPNWLLIIQNITGFALWFSFVKIGYISSK